MAIRDIVTRGYGFDVKKIPSRGYLSSPIAGTAFIPTLGMQALIVGQIANNVILSNGPIGSETTITDTVAGEGIITDTVGNMVNMP